MYQDETQYRVCLIGDTHAGMLLASDAKNDVDLVTIAKPSLRYEDLCLRSDTLLTKTARLNNQISRAGLQGGAQLIEFDAFVIVGMSASAFQAMGLLQSHDLCVSGAVREVPFRKKKRQCLSYGAFYDAFVEMHKSSFSWQVAKDLRKHTNAPIFVISQPQPAVSVLDPDSRFPGFRRVDMQGVGNVVLECQNKSLSEAYCKIDKCFALVQPSSTIDRSFLTAVEYMTGAMHLDCKTRQPDWDVKHANKHLGSLYWNMIINQIDIVYYS